MIYLIVAVLINLTTNFTPIFDKCIGNNDINSATIYDQSDHTIYDISDLQSFRNINGQWAGTQNSEETEWLDVPDDTFQTQIVKIVLDNSEIYARVGESQSNPKYLYVWIFEGYDLSIYHPLCGVFKIDKRTYETITERE